MKTTRAFLAFLPFILLICMPALLSAQVPYNLGPSWESIDLPSYSTGAAWADINRDGWLDLVVSNGNDMDREKVVVYFNDGTGRLPDTPGWQSQDIDFHGHLSIADVNHDGYPDIAVSVYLGEIGFDQRGYVKLYMNHNGVPEQLPSWRSADSMYTFSCAFGDADGDGWPDLAVAAGESYNHKQEYSRIYYNHSGTLDALPGWKSAAPGYNMDVTWADVDKDNRLDLVFACENMPNVMYHNFGDSIGTVPSWRSADASKTANTVFMADVDNDGYPDLAISDNNQLGGNGRFKLYMNHNGTLDTTPAWQSSFNGYGSGINLVDVNNDGYRDIVTGGWWQPCRIYLNSNGTFHADPDWTSSTGSVVEAIVFGDLDADGIKSCTDHFTAPAAGRVFTLLRTPVHEIQQVSVDGVALDPQSWCADLENGWISIAPPIQQGASIDVRYSASQDLDMAISNWDNDVGNYLFINTNMPVSTNRGPGTKTGFILHPASPNPFSKSTGISFDLASPEHVTVTLYNEAGCVLRSWSPSSMFAAGNNSIPIDTTGLPAGAMFCRVQHANGGGTIRLMKLSD